MSQSFRILLIDNDNAFPQTAETFARLQGWEFEWKSSPDGWYVDKHRPSIVLLDYTLDRGSDNQNWVTRLREEGLLNVTWLTSGTADGAIEFTSTHGLRGFLHKPIDLGRLPELLASSGISENSSHDADVDLKDLATKLGPAIDILDIGDFSVSWCNHAGHHSLTSHDHQLLRLLETALIGQNDTDRPSVQRLDWDAAHVPPAFRQTRLYAVGEHYWLTRDWRQGEIIHDNEIFGLDGLGSIDERLNAAAMYLARQHGITRLRVYKVAELPALDQEVDSGPLMMPMFQRGGGFREGHKSDLWRKSGFLLRENFAAARVESNEYQCNVECVGSEGENVGCSLIVFGNSPPQTRAQFPVRDECGKLRIILAFDRRHDHFGKDHPDRELASLATRLYGIVNRPLDDNDIKSMSGLLDDLGKRLLKWIIDDEDTRERIWHKAISDVLRETLGSDKLRPRDAEPSEDLSEICRRLIEVWKNKDIAGQVYGLLPEKNCLLNSPDPLNGWYLALRLGENTWQAIAGAGEVYEAYRLHGRALPLSQPQALALGQREWNKTVIQDFSSWFERAIGAYSDFLLSDYAFLGECPLKIGAWFGIPIPLGVEGEGVMVVHSPYRFHFTEMRCRLLREAAKRLLPPLVSALRESKTRSAFTGAVMHEVKNDAASAMLECEALERELAAGDAGRVEQHLGMLKHYLEGMDKLGQDFLNVLRPDPSTILVEDDLEYELGQTDRIVVGPWVENLQRPWAWLYPERLGRIEDKTEGHILIVPAHVWLRQVTRVLLQNAFRHGAGPVNVFLEKVCRDGRPLLSITVSNPAYSSVAQGVAPGGCTALSHIGPAAQAGTRVGLLHAKELAHAVQGSLLTRHEPIESLKSNDSDDPLLRFTAYLIWPLCTSERLK